MTTARNVYSTEPAYPVLASSLLAQSELGTAHTTHSVHETETTDWNLKEDWDIGIQNSPSIFRCGAVIGFSRLRTRSKDNDEYIAQMPRHLLTTHLLRPLSSEMRAETRAFIIYPSNFDAFAPRILLNSLQSTAGQSLSREDAIKRLDLVQLLPIHSFPNAAQAIGCVSTSLQEIQSKHADNDSIVLIVVGLDTLAEGIIRASNPVKGTALLAATLRNLTRLSRTYNSFLSVMLVNTNGLGAPHFESDKHPEKQKAPPEEDTRFSRDDGIHSIFQSPGPPLLSTLLMRTLDQGIDTHLLLSDIKSAKVAEVIKDRVGTGLGKWGIWTSK
ncbi:carboxypeptidase Y [Penicillium atrosanguineum]|uniref:carboxypeptidase Y n=1 Tax=Penicillium atrosanguineum TaxID=1132637 RepID=UPI0023837B56|nr:carboxypeptidase Y [Penicillium atrosanguineum]KAJ5290125.1 carboxypeptidase Y [Penicillium atrosanguineum]